jgi:protein-tyrosine phosphatase
VDIVAVNPGGTLFVSGDVEDWEALRERGIDTIVDMDGDVDPGLPEAPNAILYVYHPILDEELPDLTRIEALGRLVADLVSADHRVLVHCRMGLNRSVLVIATALTYLGMTGEQALSHLRECRPGALFNDAFAAHVLGLPARRLRVEEV